MNVAMILAAGRGERLRPITDEIPKALCMVKGIPLIEHHVRNLAHAGFEKIVINHAYLGGKIRQHLGSGQRFGVIIEYSPEPPGGLETAGGIVKALPLLGNKPFVAVNADIFTDFDFRQLRPEAVEYMHLILVDKNPLLLHHGDFGLTNQRVTNNNPNYTYAGIACYNPSLFTGFKQGRYSMRTVIRQHVEEQKATGQIHRGIWYDIGSIERLNAANSYYITHT